MLVYINAVITVDSTIAATRIIIITVEMILTVFLLFILNIFWHQPLYKIYIYLLKGIIYEISILGKYSYTMCTILL